uniref:Uncharacterized protein n=1 Tax=Panstrongylus lignarius TaxID=156445 RepID=A0A224XZE6_9HEMI
MESNCCLVGSLLNSAVVLLFKFLCVAAGGRGLGSGSLGGGTGLPGLPAVPFTAPLFAGLGGGYLGGVLLLAIKESGTSTGISL